MFNMMCLLMFTFITVNPQKRARHQEGVSGRQAKNSSVKKLMVVVAAPNTKESWENIETLLGELDIASLSTCPFAVDMKVQLILLGKQTGASKHTCPYGHGSALFDSPCPLITLKNLERTTRLSRLLVETRRRPRSSRTASSQLCSRVLQIPPHWNF